MEENQNQIPEISPEVAASLFEPEPEETEDPEKANIPVPEPGKSVPAPSSGTKKEETVEEIAEVTPDSILKCLTELDENGHSSAVIIATLERLHNVTKGKLLEDIPEEDREYVDDMTVENAAVDLYSLDGSLYNLILKFDSTKDAYLRELNALCNRYRDMQEGIATGGAPETDIAILSLTLMPNKLNGYGALNLTFPVGYFRVLDDNGVNASMLIQFMDENVQFQAIEMDEETRNELIADVMRESEESTSGRMYG